MKIRMEPVEETMKIRMEPVVAAKLAKKIIEHLENIPDTEVAEIIIEAPDDIDVVGHVDMSMVTKAECLA